MTPLPPARDPRRATATAALLVLGSCISLQFGAALAYQLFPAVGAWGMTTLRLGLAALLLRAPHALLLDEPSNHLDDASATGVGRERGRQFLDADGGGRRAEPAGQRLRIEHLPGGEEPFEQRTRGAAMLQPAEDPTAVIVHHHHVQIRLALRGAASQAPDVVGETQVTQHHPDRFPKAHCETVRRRDQPVDSREPAVPQHPVPAFGAGDDRVEGPHRVR